MCLKQALDYKIYFSPIADCYGGFVYSFYWQYM